MPDLLIRGARIVDGTGAPTFTGDIAIANGQITGVGERIDQPATRRIDADGRVVCPGFIDMHSHVDLVLREYPRADGMVRQGVTTSVTGNCGLSPFPVAIEARDKDSAWEHLAGFISELNSTPLATNVAPLVGHGAIRSAVMADPGGRPTTAELDRIVDATEQAMMQGACGISTGLIYDPGRFADTAELVKLAETAARYGGFYASHIRGEGDTLVDAVDEAIQIGQSAGIAVQLSHHKAKRRRNWGTVHTTLAMVDEAVNAGIDIMLDCYPYTASSTSLWAYLPHWARADDLLAADAVPSRLRQRLITELDELYPGCSAGNGAVTDLSDLTISHVVEPGPYARYEGVPLDEAAKQTGLSQAELVLDLLFIGRHVQVIDHAMSEADMHTVLAHPRCMVGSDAQSIHSNIPGRPHPRNFGTFTRFLTDVAPGRIPLEAAIHKCTGLPAQRLGWASRRGILKRGAAADLLMFDPTQLRDHATFADPKRYSTGLDLVIVNGAVVIEDDADTGASAGRFLLRRRPSGAG